MTGKIWIAVQLVPDATHPTWMRVQLVPDATHLTWMGVQLVPDATHPRSIWTIPDELIDL